MRDAPHTESQRTGRPRPNDRGVNASELVLQAPRVAVDEPIRGAPRQALAARSGPRKAHFLRMAFIGASSSAAAFFFRMARRFMAIAFLWPFLIAFLMPFFMPFIAFRMALRRIAFAITEGGGTRVAACRALLFAGMDA